MGKLKPLSKKQELEIIEFYKKHSFGPTARMFHIGVWRIEKLLYKYDIKHLTKEEVRNLKIQHRVETCMKLYNCSNGGGSKEAVQKIKNTKILKYGTSSYNNLDKYKETMLLKYGVDNIFKDKEYLKNCCIKKHGVPYSSQIPGTIEKAKKTCLLRYGEDNFAKTLLYHKKARKHYYFKGECFDSSWELALYVYAKDHNEYIERCPCSFDYRYKNRSYKFFPDFKYKDLLIEIKGDHFFKSDGTMCNPFNATQNELYEAKHQCGLKNKVIFWSYKDCKFAIDYFKLNYNLKDFERKI